MNINHLISDAITEEQKAFSSRIEQELGAIINHHGHWYDRIDLRDYRKRICSLNKLSKSVFKGGLFHYQVKHYHIQMFLENTYKTPITGHGVFEFDEDIFRTAFLRALSIATYNTKVIYPIQTKMISMWLLFCYFYIKNFKPDDFATAFEIAEGCMDEDISLIEDSWIEIDNWSATNRDAIDEANAESNFRRKFMRNARRIVYRRLKPHELEQYHFIARASRTYTSLISDVSRVFHISPRSALKRAKELGITEETYDRLSLKLTESKRMEESEIEYYTEQLNKGPYTKREAKVHYYERFNRFRTFGSAISPMNEEEQAEYDKQQIEYLKMEEEAHKKLLQDIEKRQIEYEEEKKRDPLLPNTYDPLRDMTLLFR